MRKGSAAIVPLFIGIMLLFWAIMFLGSGGDTLHSVNKVENLSHLQTKLLVPAVKKYYVERYEKNKTDAKANETANSYIKTIMQKNGIDK